MGYVYSLIAALLFGANGSVTKVIVDAGLTPAQLTFFRVLTSAVLAGLILLLTDRRAFRVSPRQLVDFAVLGVVGVALCNSLTRLRSACSRSESRCSSNTRPF